MSHRRTTKTSQPANQQSPANATKAALLKKLAALEDKIQQWEQQRMTYVGQLAKRYNLIDLSNTVLMEECRALQKKYGLPKKDPADAAESAQVHPRKKNTSPSTPATNSD